MGFKIHEKIQELLFLYKSGWMDERTVNPKPSAFFEPAAPPQLLSSSRYKPPTPVSVCEILELSLLGRHPHGSSHDAMRRFEASETLDAVSGSLVLGCIVFNFLNPIFFV